VPLAELTSLYAGAACAVVPVRDERRSVGTENSGAIALLEAMACARPAVVTDRSHLRDYLEDGTTALSVPAEDPDALSGAIGRILDDPDLGARLGGAARARAEARHSTRAFAARLADVLTTLDA
jgi:glycosyltransferase involved in cell wall biosynthesis